VRGDPLSPIFVRPVREQLEHDRLIRFLQAKFKRKYDVAINMGEERTTPVKSGTATAFPDLVLMTGRKIAGVIEVETGESVNNLEAMAQWVPMGRSRVPFQLYVPVTSHDVARRLCESNQVDVAEFWTYRPTAEGFDLVRLFHAAAPASPAQVRSAARAATAAAARKKTAPKPARKAVAKAKKAPKRKGKR